MRIYVASSWRNMIQPAVVAALRSLGNDVYDFRHPEPGDDGFSWQEIDGGWQTWTPERFREALKHPAAVRGFTLDERAVRESDATLLVLPCGRSAHIELGFAVGRGQRTAVFMPEPSEPELMYRWCSVLVSWDELTRWGEALALGVERRAVEAALREDTVDDVEQQLRDAAGDLLGGIGEPIEGAETRAAACKGGYEKLREKGGG